MAELERPVKRRRVDGSTAAEVTSLQQSAEKEEITHLLYVRWFGGEGQTKLNKLQLRQIESVTQLEVRRSSRSVRLMPQCSVHSHAGGMRNPFVPMFEMEIICRIEAVGCPPGLLVTTCGLICSCLLPPAPRTCRRSLWRATIQSICLTTLQTLHTFASRQNKTAWHFQVRVAYRPLGLRYWPSG